MRSFVMVIMLGSLACERLPAAPSPADAGPPGAFYPQDMRHIEVVDEAGHTMQLWDPKAKGRP